MQREHSPGLFVKIACVVVLGVLIISMFTLGAAFHLTKRGYVASMQQSNQQILQMVQEKMAAENDQITKVELAVNNSWAFSQYLQHQYENPQNYQLVYNMTKSLHAVTPKTFYDVAVVGVEGQQYVTNQTSLAMPVDTLLKSSITMDACQTPSRILYRYVPHGITRASQGESAFVALKALTYPSTQKIYGFAYIVLKQKDLRAFFDNLNGVANHLLLMDPTGLIVSSAESAEIGHRQAELQKVVQGMVKTGQTSCDTSFQGKPALVLAQEIPRWNLYAVSVVAYTQAFNERSGSLSILAGCAVATALVVAVLFVLIRQITQPIHKLVKTMEGVTQNGLPDHIEVLRGGYEAQRLSQAFSLMIAHLHQDVQRMLQMEQEKRRMELETLQMQINPHFIYNTLTSLKWLIWQRDTPRAIRSIDTFTLLLRSTISCRQTLVPVREEIQNLQRYIFLQKIRYGPRIQTEVYVAPSASGCYVPNLLLQPLLENAFFHAFANCPSGMISISVACHGQRLICEIIDNGIGMPQKKADALLNKKAHEGKHSIGIPNVNARIRLLFGEAYGLQIFSEPGRGTSVKITLPAVYSADEHL